MRARPQLLAGEHAVTIPVVDTERLIAPVPFVARDDAVVVAIHGGVSGRVAAASMPVVLRHRADREPEGERRERNQRQY